MYFNHNEDNQVAGGFLQEVTSAPLYAFIKGVCTQTHTETEGITKLITGFNSLAYAMHGIRMGDYADIFQLFNLWIFEFRLLVHMHLFMSTVFSSFKKTVTFCWVIFFIFRNMLHFAAVNITW